VRGEQVGVFEARRFYEIAPEARALLADVLGLVLGDNVEQDVDLVAPGGVERELRGPRGVAAGGSQNVGSRPVGGPDRGAHSLAVGDDLRAAIVVPEHRPWVGVAHVDRNRLHVASRIYFRAGQAENLLVRTTEHGIRFRNQNRTAVGTEFTMSSPILPLICKGQIASTWAP
jgi:hypothetical protein